MRLHRSRDDAAQSSPTRPIFDPHGLPLPFHDGICLEELTAGVTMRFGKLMRFVLQATTAGLAAAFVLLVFFPELLNPDAVVEIKQDAIRPHGADDPLSQAGGSVSSYANAVAKAAPAVVSIYSGRRPSSPALANAPSTFATPGVRVGGSGVLLSERGYILTNNHLVSGADEISVRLQDSRGALASVVGTDSETDLAVLKIDLPDLPSVSISRSSALRVGDVVLAIGNPFGFSQTVTMGIVSATGRHQLGLSVFEDFIQTDAAINPGNSGGALIDSHGLLVGINTAIFTESEGLGFAIPIDLAKEVMRAIIERGYVARGWLGAGVHAITDPIPALPATGGVRLGDISPESPAFAAGLESGDILTHIDEQTVSSPREAAKLIAASPPGHEVALRIIRDGEPRTVTARLGEREPP